MSSNQVMELMELLGYKKNGDSFKNNRNFYNTKVLPFFSRNPERAKFTNGFYPIISALLRISSKENAEYKFSSEEFKENLNNHLDEGPNKQEFIELLMKNFDSFNFKSLYFIKFISLSDSNERVGEIEIALLLNELFNLSELQEWYEKLNSSEPKNLLEKLLSQSFPEINEDTKKRRNFHLMDGEYYRSLAQRDLVLLLKDREFFIENMELFFAYYYFFYVTQVMVKIQMSNANENPEELYYALESERITSTRLAHTAGYKKVVSTKKDLLPRLDYLDYLNVLIGNKGKYYFTKDFNELTFEEETILEENLNKFNAYYAVAKNKRRTGKTLEKSMKDLFSWLKEDIDKALISRFSLSLDEIAKKYFVKPRGRLGNTLNMTNDLLLMFTALIVSDKKMLVEEVFKGFEDRGMYFDRYTKSEILDIYNNSNILEKKSDSGDAQYVKPIL